MRKWRVNGWEEVSKIHSNEMTNGGEMNVVEVQVGEYVQQQNVYTRSSSSPGSLVQGTHVYTHNTAADNLGTGKVKKCWGE